MRKRSVAIVVLVSVILVCNLTVEAFSFNMPSFWYKKRLEDIEGMIAQEKYDEAYFLYLENIPRFNPYAKRCEALFYRYVHVCIETGRFDEAEGYLYRIRTKKTVLEYQVDYDYYWALLHDRREHLEKAYEKYHFFVTMYPHDARIVSARFRLAQLALRRARFTLAREQFALVALSAPGSEEGRIVSEIDDDTLKGYFIAFDMYADRAEAEKRQEELREKSIDVFVHVGYCKGVVSYIVGFGLYPRHEAAVAVRDEYAAKGYSVSIYPKPLSTDV